MKTCTHKDEQGNTLHIHDECTLAEEENVYSPNGMNFRTVYPPNQTGYCVAVSGIYIEGEGELERLYHRHIWPTEERCNLFIEKIKSYRPSVWDIVDSEVWLTLEEFDSRGGK